MAEPYRSLPEADSETGLVVLRDLIKHRSLLSVLEIMHQRVGGAFRISLPRFKPAVLVGAQWNRTLLVDERDKLNWRIQSDPVTELLRHGILVEDGDKHDQLRGMMEGGLRRRATIDRLGDMVFYTDEITSRWKDEGQVDMLVEMRRIALLILFGTLFNVDLRDDLDRLWKPILKAIQYISPSWWIVLPELPRFGYKRYIETLDDYLMEIIRDRRRRKVGNDDWLTGLIESGLRDDLIRDQMMTMLIAGHDTSTALLAWTLYLLGSHPKSMARARDEVDDVIGRNEIQEDHLGKLHYLEQVIKESLRLYPPIHVGNRLTNSAIQAHGCHIPEETRLMYSIYLSHRDIKVWPEASCFRPERFDRKERSNRSSLAYVPFGGGPRNCIGAVFAQVEAKVILANILQNFDLTLANKRIRKHMGATLEPRPGVYMIIKHRGSGIG